LALDLGRKDYQYGDGNCGAKSHKPRREEHAFMTENWAGLL
jgi:hypothetical protein